MKKHQGIPLFNPPFFYNRPMIDRRKCSTQKTEDRKAIRKSARRTFLSLTTCSEQHPRKRESQGADAVSTGWTYLETPLIGFSVFCVGVLMQYKTDGWLIRPFILLSQTSHTENIPYALINQLELNVESHSRTLLCTQTTHLKSGQIVQESF